jgi:hypothetical protein
LDGTIFYTQPAQGAVDCNLLVRIKEHCFIGASVYADSASIAFFAVNENHPCFSDFSDGFNRTDLGAGRVFAMPTRDWFVDGWLCPYDPYPRFLGVYDAFVKERTEELAYFASRAFQRVCVQMWRV